MEKGDEHHVFHDETLRDARRRYACAEHDPRQRLTQDGATVLPVQPLDLGADAVQVRLAQSTTQNVVNPSLHRLRNHNINVSKIITEKTTVNH